MHVSHVRPTCLFLHTVPCMTITRCANFSNDMHTALHCTVCSDAPYTDCKQTSIHTCLHSTRSIDAHATRDISFFNNTPSTATVWTVWTDYPLRAYTSFYFIHLNRWLDERDACIYFRRLCLLIGHRCSFKAMSVSVAH